MKKITWNGEKVSLTGNLITQGSDMSFDLLDSKGKAFTFKPGEGLTIVSTFPALNTTICDVQTTNIAQYASMYKNISWVSITVDEPAIIDKWCLARRYGNVQVYSDYKRDFGKQTNTLIKKKDKLTRGFMIFKDGVLQETVYRDEVQTEPGYDQLQKYFK